MDLNKFIKKFSSQFEETDPSLFESTTEFKTLDEWSSLTALSIIAMVDDQYAVTINIEDIRKASTIEDLFTLITKKK